MHQSEDHLQTQQRIRPRCALSPPLSPRGFFSQYLPLPMKAFPLTRSLPFDATNARAYAYRPLALLCCLLASVLFSSPQAAAQILQLFTLKVPMARISHHFRLVYVDDETGETVMLEMANSVLVPPGEFDELNRYRLTPGTYYQYSRLLDTSRFSWWSVQDVTTGDDQ